MTRQRAAPEGNPRTLCAIYTRKSTEEGLEQEFNTLHAQRESGEAYVASQRAEGWVCLPDRYDDGGYTGANMERPALTRLLEDIKAGKVDCVVVYKVDRLSRSLLDFARMMEVFEKHKVSFVSVTQQFNTAHSMGRLVLNVLLSFAQFERELISERTRDKIAAARRKGKWAGGKPVLGYDLVGGKLRVNEAEAGQVRRIFAVYLREQSLNKAVAAVNREGLRSKAWTTAGGKRCGGLLFHKSLLQKLLTNVAYLGKVRHNDNVFSGEHAAIIEAEVWERVQAMLRVNGHAGGTAVRNKYGALLKGLLYCGCCGVKMTHTHTRKGSVCYRYYACHGATARGRKPCASRSIPAEQVEQFVIQRLQPLLSNMEMAAHVMDAVNRTPGPAVPRPQVEGELRRFDPMWQCLSSAEKARIIGLLVKRVEFDGEGGCLRITLHDGVQATGEEAA